MWLSNFLLVKIKRKWNTVFVHYTRNWTIKINKAKFEINNMKRNEERASAEGYCIQVLVINDEVQEQQTQKSYYIKNIGKGGFRFVSDAVFELEDRVRVLLRFPDGYSQEVLGRICYNDDDSSGQNAYGFSVIDGFYSLHESASLANKGAS